jgi:hypothetical protein
MALQLGNLLGNLTGALGGAIGGATGGSNVQGKGFQQILTYADFQQSADVTLSTTEFKRIGQYTVGAQTLVRWGYGVPNTENQGRMYMTFYSGGGAIHGLVRLKQTNAQETINLTVFEISSRVLNGSATDKTQQIPLPEQTGFPYVGQDSKFIVEMKGEAAHVFDYDDTTNIIWLLPITRIQ